MKKMRMLWKILKLTYTDRLFTGFIIIYLIVSLIIMLAEPSVNTYGDSLWFCFVTFTSIGFGDFFAVTLIGRISLVILTLYGIIILALIPGVFVSFYQENLRIREKTSQLEILDKLENLDTLSKEELKKISEKIKKSKLGEARSKNKIN